VVADSGSVPEPAVAEAEARQPAGPAEQVDPVAGTAGILAIAAAVFAAIGLGLDYYYGEPLSSYRPGMPLYVVVVAACAVVAGFLSLAPRTRRRTGPALLFGLGFAALFGLLRFIGEGVAMSSVSSDTILGAGFTFELIAHSAVVLAGLCALIALRRASGLGAGMVRGWEGWAAIGLGVAVAAGWIIELARLAEADSSAGERATAYFVLGAALAVVLSAVAAVLRPPVVGCAVLAAGTVGLAGVLGPTFATLDPYSYLSYAGLAIAVSGLAGLLVLTVVWGVRLRNQPNGRQS
jgi:hypothetical protein